VQSLTVIGFRLKIYFIRISYALYIVHNTYYIHEVYSTFVMMSDDYPLQCRRKYNRYDTSKQYCVSALWTPINTWNDVKSNYYF